MINKEYYLYWIILLSIGIAWGLSFSLSVIVAISNSHPLGLVYWQVIISSIILFALLKLKKIKFSTSFPNLIIYLIISLSGVVLPGIVFFIAATKVPAGILSISVSFVPMLTYFFSLFLRVEKFSFIRVLGVLVGLISILFLILPQNSFPENFIIPWILLAMICPFFYTFENLYIELKKPHDMHPVSLSLGASLISMIILTPVILLSDSFTKIVFPFSIIEWSLLALGFISAFAYTFFVYLISKAGAVFAANTGYIVTISGVIWGIILFKETHSLWVWLSLFTMICGLSLVRPKENLNNK